VVLAVVDPGVATERRAVAVEVGGGASVLVGPDNGLLAPAVAMCGGADRAVVLDDERWQLPSPGPTFAGRDVFAPAAAHLCTGVDLAELGTAVDPVTLLPGMLPVPFEEDGALVAQVLWVDHYGNAQLNVDPVEAESLGERVRLRSGDERRTARRVGSFAEIGPNEVGLVVDSYGMLAVAVDRHSAAAALGLGPGAEVRLEAIDEGDDDTSGGVTTAVVLTRKDSQTAEERTP